MDELSKKFPAGLEYTIIYNPTEFIQQSIDAVTETIVEAILLVVLVVILFPADLARRHYSDRGNTCVADRNFFSSWRSSGFSLNNLSLFGLVLAVGIVVDDAIVVGGKRGAQHCSRPGSA